MVLTNLESRSNLSNNQKIIKQPEVIRFLSGQGHSGVKKGAKEEFPFPAPTKHQSQT